MFKTMHFRNHNRSQVSHTRTPSSRFTNMAQIAIRMNDEDNYSPNDDEKLRKNTCCGRWIERGSVSAIIFLTCRFVSCTDYCDAMFHVGCS